MISDLIKCNSALLSEDDSAEFNGTNGIEYSDAHKEGKPCTLFCAPISIC
jgi:hypothetical protein